MSDTYEQIGPRLRSLRKRGGVTLDALASLTGLTKGYLSKIETGKKVPPIGTLSRIARGLNCEMAYFFQETDTAAPDERISLVRASERRQVIRGGSSFGYDYESIAHGFPGKAMDPFVFTFPSDIKGDTYFDHEGQELIFVLAGVVEFEISDRVITLTQGDSVYFDASLRHRGKSVGGKAQALVVIYTP